MRKRVDGALRALGFTLLAGVFFDCLLLFAGCRFLLAILPFLQFHAGCIEPHILRLPVKWAPPPVWAAALLRDY